MIGSFSFKGVDSESFGLICRSVKRPLLPGAKFARVEFPGTSGAYDYDHLEYQLRQVTMNGVYLGTSFNEMRSRARNIAAWLSSSTWGRLIINDEPDKYYLAKVTGEIDLQSVLEAGAFEVTFDCQPFAYSVDEQVATFSGSMDDLGDYENFTNPGTRVINYRSPDGCKSIISATVQTDKPASFLLNGKSLTYTGTGGALVIDNVNMEATINGQNAFGNLSGNIDTFLEIVPGLNVMSSVDATNVTITYIPIWI
jgi:predicted phage tail component-like protein